jgi:hypothetical protein
MGEIIEASQLPEGEKVYLKKDSLGWRVVEPIRMEGKINLFRLIFGSKRNLFILIFLMVIVVSMYFGIQEIITATKAECVLNISKQIYGGDLLNGARLP